MSDQPWTYAAPVTVCTSCQAPNADDANFCSSCGSPIAHSCPACGAPATGRFCSKCGAALEPAASKTPVASRSEVTTTGAERRITSVL
ncbi:MAG TPA: zinc-ribbon domain-containing protein, partial [Mycobacteriales bacterium]|nr:zinc-ribbon domain-containing protein [Mycobacteriales bacterium]